MHSYIFSHNCYIFGGFAIKIYEKFAVLAPLFAILAQNPLQYQAKSQP